MFLLLPLPITFLKWSLLLKTLLKAGLLPFLAWILLYVEREAPSFARISFDPEYDYIVVGGGSAGAVLAARLSEDPLMRVLLLEAGGSPSALHDVPLLAAEFQKTRVDWQYKTVPQDAACFGLNNRQSVWPRGKVLGGSSVLNYMLYVRGNRKDYDQWDTGLGCAGWSWKEVFPYFLKSENNRDPDILAGGYHVTGGPVTVERAPFRTPLGEAFVAAGETLGYPRGDYNGHLQTRFDVPQGTVQNGKRVSTSKAFLHTARYRPNLHILTNAKVLKLLLEGRHCIGVLFRLRGRLRTVHANREVILSAGSINSPQILMLSGIGPAQHLRSLGIPVVMDLPVGRNLHDHIGAAGLSFQINQTLSVVRKRVGLDKVIQYIFAKDGPLTLLGGVEGVGFLKTKYNNDTGDWPDAEIHFISSSPAGDGGSTIKKVMGISDKFFERVYRPYLNLDSFTLYPVLLRPRSRGYVKLRSSDPDDPPLINPRYLTKNEDVLTLVEAMKQCFAIGMSEPFKKFGARPFSMIFPGCEIYPVRSDKYLACLARTYTATIYHPVGTCKMGSPQDPSTVVDPLLRVKGIKGLRVVDASVIPKIPSGNTNAPVIMVAERAADLLKVQSPIDHRFPLLVTWKHIGHLKCT
ncbi:glucose dehydrogenase [FAD, quinone]-like isoform X2 [Varroa jacobsoni]|uniref:glucose dehydrogenase [FAD, quinone]-like isoform X2 n=1 Tax=Varroa jacobsoni TaxID=62625 RepID=UPI000BF9BD6D|nr:glucose dehydrogenase [FAD, quinone]-like isoform X2 [Varroa jacobsoni]